MKHVNPRRLAACLAALAGVLMIGFAADKVVNPDPSSATPTTPTTQEGCASQVHYFAYDAPAGSNQFGPAIADPSLEAGKNRWQVKLCEDPVFTAAWEDIIVNNGANANPEWINARAHQFLDNRPEWQAAAVRINDSITQMEVADRTETYHTELMQLRDGDLPLVRRTDRPVAMGHVLVFHLKDGRTEYARYVCDLQPARPEFPGLPAPTPVPPGSPPPRVPPTTPPSVPPTTTPPTTTPPTTAPPTTTPPTTRPPCETDESGKCKPPTTQPAPPTLPPPTGGGPTYTPPSEGESGTGAPDTGVTPPAVVAPPGTIPVPTSAPPTQEVDV